MGTGRTGGLRALVLACHPVPALAVTLLSLGLAYLARLPPGRAVLVGAAVLAGQLSIGWGNDYLDAERDTAAGRGGKPVASGAVGRASVRRAALVALVAAVPLSGALGLAGGAAALGVTAVGWTYNVGLKATAFSWLPYAVAFGVLPSVATGAARPPHWAPAWAAAAGALLGVAAHLANVLPDLSADAATGVRGLPHRLGARGTALGGALLLLAASVVILAGPPGGPGAWSWAGAGVAVVVGGTAVAVALRDPESRRYFPAVIVVALLDLACFALTGTRW